MIKKSIAKLVRKVIPEKLSIFNQVEGCEFLSRYFPVTKRKLIIAITGAIKNERTVAKSTNSIKFPANCSTTIRDPAKRTNRNKT